MKLKFVTSFWWLFASMALLSCSGTSSAKPTIIDKIKGYTLETKACLQCVDNVDYQWRQFSSIAFENGKILAISEQSLVSKYADAIVIDGKGKVMLPGLIDAHGHILNLGKARLQIDVRGITSAKQTAKSIADYAKQNEQLNWILGRGWNQELWPDKKYPTSQDLDEYVADKPVWITRVDGHAGWANRKALESVGINKSTVDPDGGLIVRDKNGEPTGVLVDNAMYLLTKKLPKQNQAERQLALELAQKHLISLGITSVHDAGISHDEYHLYLDNAKKNQLDMRIYAMLAAEDSYIKEMLSRGYINDERDMLTIRSVKLSVDGALGSRGAAMLQPYSDKPEQSGLMLWSNPQLERIYHMVLKEKFQLNVHAIGDKGNKVVLDNFAATFKKVGGQSLRNRIEHAQVVTVEDIKRFKQLDIIASMQPTHATSDMNMAEDRVGRQRLAGAYAWQTFLKQGTRIAAGSDFPVELANPFFGLHAAVTRQSREHLPKGGWRANEAMDIGQALKAFSIDAAYAAHQDEIIGSLEVGKWADFIVLDSDVFNMDYSKLWQVEVLQTWVGGEKKYSRN